MSTTHLEADTIVIPGQQYALISIVSETSNQKHKECGVKIRGVFNTRADAEVHAKKLQQVDKSFDVFLVEMYKWLLVPPDISKIDDQTHMDTKLNEIIMENRNEQIRSQEVYESRKEHLMKGDVDPIDDPSAVAIDKVSGADHPVVVVDNVNTVADVDEVSPVTAVEKIDMTVEDTHIDKADKLSGPDHPVTVEDTHVDNTVVADTNVVKDEKYVLPTPTEDDDAAEDVDKSTVDKHLSAVV